MSNRATNEADLDYRAPLWSMPMEVPV